MHPHFAQCLASCTPNHPLERPVTAQFESKPLKAGTQACKEALATQPGGPQLNSAVLGATKFHRDWIYSYI